MRGRSSLLPQHELLRPPRFRQVTRRKLCRCSTGNRLAAEKLHPQRLRRQRADQPSETQKQGRIV